MTSPIRIDPSVVRRKFNHGWSYRTKATVFQELGSGGAGDWVDVLLPHDAMINSERSAEVLRGDTSGYYSGGSFEYRTSFPVDASERGKLFVLEFDGVYRDAMVFVNGNLAGQHAYGYSRFTVRIDPYLNFGGDNEVRVECRAHLDSRWYSGAGIHRDVHLITKHPTHIAVDGVRVTTPDIDEDRAVVEVEVTVENSSGCTSTLRLAATIADAGGADVATGSAPITLLPGERGVARQRLYVENPALWNVDSPNLYNLSLQLSDADTVVDAESLSFGIRSLQLDPKKGLRINGTAVKLRGSSIHSDNGPIGAVSIAAAEERRVRLLKEAGFNAIRNSHNPASTALLEACDKIGMLVMDETFDMWTSGKSDFDYAFDFTEWFERDVEAMVVRDFNHPSVIFYSIGNEIPELGTGIGARWGRKIAEKVRSLDETRFVTNGINPFVATLDTVLPMMRQRRAAEASAPASGEGVNGMMDGFGAMMGHIQASDMATTRTEESFSVLDAAGLNYADSRYAPDSELFPNRIIVGTESWTTQIATIWGLVEEHSHVLGDFGWVGWDYLGENGIGVIRYADEEASGSSGFSGGFPGLTAGSGDIDITGVRRPASYYREIVFGLREQPYIAVQRPEHYGKTIAVATLWAWSDTVGSWSWPGFEGKPVRVEVYSRAEEVELLLNGKPVARVTVGENKPLQADFELSYAPGELTAVAYTGGAETGRFSLASASGALALEAEADRSELCGDGSDLAFIALTLCDGFGTVINGVDRPISVVIDGPAVLQGFGSGNPMSAEAFTTAEHTSFDGRALAVIRPTGAGVITITAATAGCAPVVLTLIAGDAQLALAQTAA